ncbi:hypothetical protein Taro_013365 [Colocasia esculenta]|uniref:Uncharacterized protein n=1 Tax=Colocasia esculenta TaxID=4460 RepID=A0A843U6D0_COLES|nr:hypothetical protein [Colocasia esculenta]
MTGRKLFNVIAMAVVMTSSDYHSTNLARFAASGNRGESGSARFPWNQADLAIRLRSGSAGSDPAPRSDSAIHGSQFLGYSSCPSSVQWPDDGLEKDLYIQSRTVTVLAMDGKRRWLDIRKLGSNGGSHFALVTNLAPCSGIRFHLWPEKNRSEVKMPMNRHVVEVTAKMVQIPAGPAPRQIEPGSQTEQAPPSAVIQLSPKEMRGFRFLTISVAPRLMLEREALRKRALGIAGGFPSPAGGGP